MIGVIPSGCKTLEVVGLFDDIPMEDKIYIDPNNQQLYYYSTTIKRSNPDTGFLPIWDGTRKYVSKYSIVKYESDMIPMNIDKLSSTITADIADRVEYLHRRINRDDILQPVIKKDDNMFTQIVKGIISNRKLTIVDISYLSKLSENVVNNYYSNLVRISFMRNERWKIWVSQIFHLQYRIIIYDHDTELVSLKYPSGELSIPSNVKVAIDAKDDELKKLVKVVIAIKNITKSQLRSLEINDHTVNNMLSTIWSSKSLSAQLFSRFIRMTKLSFVMEIYDQDKLIFTYRE